MAGRSNRQKSLYQIEQAIAAIDDCKEHLANALVTCEGQNATIGGYFPHLNEMLNEVKKLLQSFYEEARIT